MAEDGETLIIYIARLRWGPLSLSYSSRIERPARGETRVTTSLWRSSAPLLAGAMLTWSSKRLGLAGRWTALGPAVAETLFERDDGTVEWHCRQPMARAEIERAGAPPLRGLGYVEQVVMALPPWRLPIDELRWGRFLSPEHSLVWIDWRGSESRRLVVLDGVRLGPACVDDGGVRTDDGSVVLSLSGGELLREGALGRTALAVIPRVNRLLPARALAAHERKWRTRATLRHPRGLAEGWAIHEVVSWP